MAYASIFRIVRTRVSVMILLAVCLTVSAYLIRAAGQEKEVALCSSETTTAAMQRCENLRYQRAQQALDSAYAGLTKQLDETGKAKLRSAQAAWLRFRRADSEFAADAARGGTLAPLIQITVLADLTEARTVELKKSLRP